MKRKRNRIKRRKTSKETSKWQSMKNSEVRLSKGGEYEKEEIHARRRPLSEVICDMLEDILGYNEKRRIHGELLISDRSIIGSCEEERLLRGKEGKEPYLEEEWNFYQKLPYEEMSIFEEV